MTVYQSSNLLCEAGRRTSLSNAFVYGINTQSCLWQQQQQGYSTCQRQSRLSRRSCLPRFVRLVAWKNPEGLHLLSKTDTCLVPSHPALQSHPLWLWNGDCKSREFLLCWLTLNGRMHLQSCIFDAQVLTFVTYASFAATTCCWQERPLAQKLCATWVSPVRQKCNA